MKKIITVLLILICVGCCSKCEREYTVIDHAGNSYQNMKFVNGNNSWSVFVDKNGKRHVFQGNFSYSETTKAEKE